MVHGPYSLTTGAVKGAWSEPRDAAVQIVLIRALDFGGDDLADPQRPPAREIDRAVDLRRVGFRAAF